MQLNIKKPRKSRSWLYWNGGLALLALILFFVLSPSAANTIVFQGMVLNWPYLAILLIGIGIAVPLIKGLNGKRPRRSIIGLVVVGSTVICCWIATSTFVDYLTYHNYANFNSRTAMVATDPDRIRFTARKIAFKDIENSITAATEEVQLKYTHPLVTKDGFAFVSAITPDGLLPTWASDNPGFVFFDDRNGVDTKVRRINQPQAYGLGELWTDNFWWGVYHTDWWATYETPHFLPLNPENPNDFTAIVPKIKYSWWLMPYWAGTLLVHDDGTIEDLTAAEAQKDKRLKGKWIAPLDLMRDYVEYQNYAVGYISSFFRVPGKLEIDDVEDLNKFPFVTRGSDGRDYFVVATKAEGSGGGLFRMYYATADTFELTVHEFDPTKTVYGPNAAWKRVFNLSGYNWFRQDGDSKSGNMTAIEPIYVVRPGDENNLFWKFSVTTKDFTGTAASAVVNGSNLDSFKDFKSRGTFEAWLRSTKPLHAKIVQDLESQTGQKAPEGLSLADQIRWHADQIRVLTQEMQK